LEEFEFGDDLRMPGGGDVIRVDLHPHIVLCVPACGKSIREAAPIFSRPAARDSKSHHGRNRN
jgi:hypothetical protein